MACQRLVPHGLRGDGGHAAVVALRPGPGGRRRDRGRRRARARRPGGGYGTDPARALRADARILIPERPIPSGAVVGHEAAEGTGETGPVSTDDVTMMIIELAGG